MERCILACSGMAWKMGKYIVNVSVLKCYFVLTVIFKTVEFYVFGNGLGLIMHRYEHEESLDSRLQPCFT